MTILATRSMARRLTVPFARGSETLQLTLAQGDATQASVVPYNFAEHSALFNRPPEPRYVIVALQDAPTTFTLNVDYQITGPGGSQTTKTLAPPLTIPAGTVAGSTFALDLGADEEPATRLIKVTMSPSAPDGVAANWWGLTALLGNLAKLLWITGCERDYIRRHMERIKAQRQLSKALGLSLDLLGFDLGIPRFPPLPYSFDPDTLALYHLDDPPESTEVEDTMKLYGGPGYQGKNVGGIAGVVARFGTGFAFRDSNAEIQIPDDAAFDLGTTNSFTVECFAKPEVPAGEGDIIAKHADPADNGLPGWALSVGEFGRGLSNNVRFLLSDGMEQILLFADESLSSSRFYHLAGVIDRQASEARLYLNGEQRMVESISALGELTNPEPIRISSASGNAFQGVVDEVRLSSIARSRFEPIFGEVDENYQRRLRIFERWTLPTPSELSRLLNETVGTIAGSNEPLIVNDTNATLIRGSHTLTIYPVELKPRECIDSLGNRHVHEADVSGTAAAENTFDPIYLVSHNDPNVIYTVPQPRTLGPGELPPDPHKMQLVTKHRLDMLLSLVASQAGQLRVESAFDPRANDLRAVGRGLLLTHSTINLGQLAALAHRAGFSFVCYQANPDMVYVSVALSDYVEIQALTGTGFGSSDVAVGDTINLSLLPALPVDTIYRWVTIPCGPGRSKLTASADGKTASLDALAPGQLIIKVDASRRGRTVTSTRVLQIGLKELANNATIANDGTMGVAETVAGEADSFFSPAFLIKHDDTRVDYGTDPNHHLMQPSVARRLTNLLELITHLNPSGKLTIVEAFVPNATGLRGVGRALTLRHASLTAGQLGALAQLAGFTFVNRQDPNVLLRQATDELAAITGPHEVNEGESIHLAASAKPGDVEPGVRLTWVLRFGGQAQARLSSTTSPEVDLQAERAGQVLVRVVYQLADNTAPYTFEVRLESSLEADPKITIRKDQYDLIMNILNVFHPIGVEVMTSAIRERVIEVHGEKLEAFPAYTYPNFVVRGPAPRQARKE